MVSRRKTIAIDLDGISTRTELARALTELREAAGLTIRELATRTGLPPATVGDYVSGRHLPSTAQLMSFTAILREFGIVDPDDVHAWVAALGRVRVATDRRVSRRDAPYRGLQPFDRTDAETFFGRAALTEQIATRVAELRGEGASPLLAVVGASGAGKSSLLQAGVVAHHERAGGTASTMLPSRSLDLPRPLPGLLVVDQFEEIFTSITRESRETFLDALAALSPADCVVILGLRADFYAAALAEPVLLAPLRRHPIVVTPMTREELTAAIVDPARVADTRVDAALVERVLADLAPAGAGPLAHDPGALPLMSHALLSTWARASANRLTLDDYEAAGGIRAAVQQSADEVYADLDADGQELSRRIFMRLVHVGEDESALTRRRVERRELLDLAPGTTVNDLIERYVARRLLTGDGDSVQITHEALLTAWPRLHEWLAADRAGARVHRQVTDAANVWAASAGDETLLLAGGRLTAALEWCEDADHAATLNPREREFLDHSERLDRDRRTAQRRANRRLKQLLAAVVALLVVASVLTFIAVRARDQAERDRAAAAAARDNALSRVLAGQSDKIVDTAPDVAAQLAVEALRTDNTPEARTAVLDRTGQTVPTRLATTGLRPLQAVAASSRRGLLAAAGAGGVVRLWRLGTPVPTPMPDLAPERGSGTVFALAFSPDGNQLFVAGADDTVTVWDTSGTTPARTATLRGFTSTIYALAVSADGTRLAAASADRSVRVWLLRQGRAPEQQGRITAGRGDVGVHALAFTPDGRLLLAGLANGYVRVLSADEPSLKTVGLARPDQQTVNTLAVGPAGHTVAVGSSDHAVTLLPLSDDGTLGAAVHLADAETQINAVAFRGGGTRLLVGSSDEHVSEYDVPSRTLVSQVGNPQAITGIAVFGTEVATASIDGYVSIWTPDQTLPRSRAAAVFNVGFSQDGNRVVVGSGSADGTAEIWTRHDATWSLAATVSSPERPGPTSKLDGSASLSPDGTLLAAGLTGGHVYLWDVTDPTAPAPLGLLHDDTDSPGLLANLVQQTAFSPDGTLLAAAGNDSTVRLWDVSDPRDPRFLERLDEPTNYTYTPTFSHDGRFLAVACADQHAYVWRIADPAHPTFVQRLSGFSNYVFATAFSPTDDVLAAADSHVSLFRVVPDAGTATVPAGTGVTPLGAPLLGSRAGINNLAFSPDGRTVAAASQDSDVYLWSVSDGAAVATLAAADSALYGVTFSPDGETLLAGAGDTQVHRWTVDTDRAAHELCAMAGASLTRAEWDQYLHGTDYDPPCR